MNKRYFQAFLLQLLILAVSAPASAQITINLAGNPPLCGGFATGSIFATVNGGQPPYQFQWSNGSQGNPITGLPAGQYALNVTDQDGNEAVDSIELIAPPPLEVPITVTACSPPGAMLAMPSGGIPPYTLLWSTGDTSASISDLPIGQYCLTVQDANNCAFINCQYIGAPLEALVTTGNAACNNPSGGGTAEVTVNGGVAPFTYQWDNGMSGPQIDSLPAGPLTVTVTAYNGCDIVVTDTIGLEESPLEIEVQTQQPGCVGDSTGWVVANAPGAFLPAAYLWNTGDTTAAVSNLPAGTYSVTVEDAMGCSGIKSFQLDNASNLNIKLEAGQPTCYGTNNGRVKVHPMDGLPPFTFKWNTGDSTNILENLSPGIYIVTVTDEAGCFQVDSVTLAYPQAFQASLQVKNASHCAAKDGKITPTINQGGSWPFSFEWSTGSTDSVLQNIGAGLYSVTITSSEGCLFVDSAMVQQPTNLVVSVSGTSLVCGNENNGMLSAAVQYGTFPYQFIWNNGATSPGIQNLAPGAYSVTVTSTEGCTGTGNKTIFSSPEVSFHSEVDSVSCHGSGDGHLGISIQTGLAPFSILWNNGATTPEISGLNGGVYAVTVTDVVGCTATETYNLPEPPPLEANILSDAGTCDTDAEMQVFASGGTVPYHYQWSTGATSQLINSSVGGTFSVTVTDLHGCTATQSVFLPEIPGIDLNIFGANTSCYGKEDGSIVAIASAGTPPFQFEWNNGASTNAIGNLPPGLYTVTVTDILGCTNSSSIYIAEGPALAVDIVAPQYSCMGSLVNATAVPSNNAAQPISFAWSNGLQTQTATGLEAGIYTVTITDALGCQGIDSVTILQGGDFEVHTVQNDISCFGAQDGMISVSTQGGLAPLEIQWSTGENSMTLSQLNAGAYTATITESITGCSKVVSALIIEPQALTAEIIAQAGLCGAPATAVVSIGGGTPPWSILWNTGDTTPVLETNTAGVYTAQVSDANGCVLLDTANLDVKPEPQAEITLLNYPSSQLAPDGELAVVYTNLEPPVQISWSNGLATDTISGLSPGAYSVTLTDANDCQVIRQFVIPFFSEIGDFVWLDQNGNGIQEPGEYGLDSIQIQATGLDFIGKNLDRVTYSDSSGHYHFTLPPGNYTLMFQLPEGYLFSSPDAGASDGTDSDVNPSTGLSPPISIDAGVVRYDIDAGYVPLDTCDNVSDAGMICCDGEVCLPGGTPIELTELRAPTGGSGDLIFQWYQSPVDQAFDPNTWQVISGANEQNFTAEPTATGYFVRAARREGCTALLSSNIVKIEVHELLTPEIAGPSTVCQDLPYAFEVVQPQLNLDYHWAFSETASLSSANGATVPYVLWTASSNAWLALSTSDGSCSHTDTLFLGSTYECRGEDVLLHGKVSSQDAVLWWKWHTDSLPGVIFNLEWATETKTFTAISTVDSTSVIDDSTYFQRIHLAPPLGKNFYRLKWSDGNGKVHYSNAVQLVIGAEGNLVQAYPNPFGNELSLLVVEDYNAEISYTLVDALGRKWLAGGFEEDDVLKSITTEDLVSGLYFLLIQYDGTLVKVIKLVRR